jgi:predicted transcriptional regulator
MSDDEMDLLFHALSHCARRRILDLLKQSPGLRVGDLAGEFGVSRVQVMKHLAVLEEAGLVLSFKAGRERKLYFNVVPIQLIHDRWSSEFSAFWASQLTGIKINVERKAGARHEES